MWVNELRHLVFTKFLINNLQVILPHHQDVGWYQKYVTPGTIKIAVLPWLMSKKYKSSLNFVFGVLVETRCVGRIPAPQLARNKPRFVAYIIVSVFCSSEGWSTSDPNRCIQFLWALPADCTKNKPASPTFPLPGEALKGHVWLKSSF
jgi:hypothetical protein